MFGHSLCSTFRLFHGFRLMSPVNPLPQKYLFFYLQAVGCFFFNIHYLSDSKFRQISKTSVDSDLRKTDLRDPCTPANCFNSVVFKLY